MYKPIDPLARKVRDLMDDSVERALYEDILGTSSSRAKRTPSPFTNITSATSANSSKIRQAGNDIISGGIAGDNAILKRLEQLEQESKQLRSQVANLTMSNEALKKENTDLSNKLDKLSVDEYASRIFSLEEENSNLKTELEQVHQFLSDYGLQWVGNNNDDELPNNSEGKDDANDDKGYSITDSKLLYDQLFKAINKLNFQTKAEPAVIQTSSDGRRARLVHADEKMDTLTVTFYFDGILINRGPFRPRDSDSYNIFVHDVCDGYFPTEYKTIYPDGFLFELVDKHDGNYMEEVSASIAADSKVGYRIGGGNGGSTNNNYSHNEAKAMSLDALCNRLPKTVINNGNIINIKDDIKNKLQGKTVNDNADAKETYKNHSRNTSNGGNSSSGNTTGNILKSATIIRLESDGDSSNSDNKAKLGIIQVRFAIIDKNTNTNHMNSNSSDAKGVSSNNTKPISQNIVLQVHVHADDTMKEVAELLLVHYQQNNNNNPSSTTALSYDKIELRNPYPSKVLRYEDTVNEAGYVPNGVMHARLTIV